MRQKVDGKIIITDYWKALVLMLFAYWKFLVLNFSGMGNTVFLSQKVDGKIIFTDYWKILVFNFSMIGNPVFSWAKKLMERWYLFVLFEHDIPGLGKYGFPHSVIG